VQDAPPARRKRRRVFMWFFLAVQVIFVIWIIAAIASVHHGSSCANLTAQECASARDVGSTIGFGLVIGLWVAVDVILGIVYIVVRLARR
jgi:uncharacterized membrane protein